MSKEICISSTPHETRLAILEDEQLTEVYYERENEYTLAGSIYKGRVTRVLPGMQSAFVDLGLERDAFLYVTDFMEEQEDSSEFERIPANGAPRRARAAGQREPAAACRMRTQKKRLRGATAPRQVREGQHPARRRQASLRMEPGAGVAAAAAARAFAPPQGGQQAAPAQEQTAQTGQPAPSVMPASDAQPSSQPDGRSRRATRSCVLSSRASRFPSTAVRVLPAR